MRSPEHSLTSPASQNGPQEVPVGRTRALGCSSGHSGAAGVVDSASAPNLRLPATRLAQCSEYWPWASGYQDGLGGWKWEPWHQCPWVPALMDRAPRENLWG